MRLDVDIRPGLPSLSVVGAPDYYSRAVSYVLRHEGVGVVLHRVTVDIKDPPKRRIRLHELPEPKTLAQGIERAYEQARKTGWRRWHGTIDLEGAA